MRRGNAWNVGRSICSSRRSKGSGRGEAGKDWGVVSLLGWDVVSLLIWGKILIPVLLNRRPSWAPKSYDGLRSWVPNGDPGLQQAWLKDYYPAVEWMRQNGIPTSDRFGPIMTIGI